MENLTLFSLTGLITFILSSIPLILSLIKGQEKIHYRLAAVSFVVALWGLSSFHIGHTLEPANSLFWWKLAHIGVILMPSTFFHFVVSLLKKEKEQIYLIISSYVIAFVFLVLNIFTNLFIKDVVFRFDEFYYITPPNIIYFLFFLYFALVVLLTLLFIFKEKSVLRGYAKRNLDYVFYGVGCAAILGSSSFLPTFGGLKFILFSIFSLRFVR